MSMGSYGFSYALYCSRLIIGQQVVGKWPTVKVNFQSNLAFVWNMLPPVYCLHVITVYLVGIINFSILSTPLTE